MWSTDRMLKLHRLEISIMLDSKVLLDGELINITMYKTLCYRIGVPFSVLLGFWSFVSALWIIILLPVACLAGASCSNDRPSWDMESSHSVLWQTEICHGGVHAVSHLLVVFKSLFQKCPLMFPLSMGVHILFFALFANFQAHPLPHFCSKALEQIGLQSRHKCCWLNIRAGLLLSWFDNNLWMDQHCRIGPNCECQLLTLWLLQIKMWHNCMPDVHRFAQTTRQQLQNIKLKCLWESIEPDFACGKPLSCFSHAWPCLLGSHGEHFVQSETHLHDCLWASGRAIMLWAQFNKKRDSNGMQLQSKKQTKLNANLTCGNHKSANLHLDTFVPLLKSEVEKGFYLPVPSNICKQIPDARVQPAGMANQTTLDAAGNRIPKLCLTQDSTFQIDESIPSINLQLDPDWYPEMVYGWCLLRIMHFTVTLRLQFPNKAILVQKFDYSDAYRRVTHAAKAAVQSIIVVLNIAYIAIRLTFGGSQNPQGFSGV